jgi:hypothetical protein
MERETLGHLLGRARTDLRLCCLCSPRQQEVFVERCLIERGTWVREVELFLSSAGVTRAHLMGLVAPSPGGDDRLSSAGVTRAQLMGVKE